MEPDRPARLMTDGARDACGGTLARARPQRLRATRAEPSALHARHRGREVLARRVAVDAPALAARAGHRHAAAALRHASTAGVRRTPAPFGQSRRRDRSAPRPRSRARRRAGSRDRVRHHRALPLRDLARVARRAVGGRGVRQGAHPRGFELPDGASDGPGARRPRARRAGPHRAERHRGPAPQRGRRSPRREGRRMLSRSRAAALAARPRSPRRIASHRPRWRRRSGAGRPRGRRASRAPAPAAQARGPSQSRGRTEKHRGGALCQDVAQPLARERKLAGEETIRDEPEHVAARGGVPGRAVALLGRRPPRTPAASSARLPSRTARRGAPRREGEAARRARSPRDRGRARPTCAARRDSAPPRGADEGERLGSPYPLASRELRRSSPRRLARARPRAHRRRCAPRRTRRALRAGHEQAPCERRLGRRKAEELGPVVRPPPFHLRSPGRRALRGLCRRRGGDPRGGCVRRDVVPRAVRQQAREERRGDRDQGDLRPEISLDLRAPSSSATVSARGASLFPSFAFASRVSGLVSGGLLADTGCASSSTFGLRSIAKGRRAATTSRAEAGLSSGFFARSWKTRSQDPLRAPRRRARAARPCTAGSGARAATPS